MNSKNSLNIVLLLLINFWDEKKDERYEYIKIKRYE